MARDIESENRRLREELDELQEEKRQRQEAEDQAADCLPQQWHLTRLERKIVLLLLRNPLRYVSRTKVLQEVGADNNPDTYASVLISRLRRKLEPVGIKIDSTWGLGYRLSPEGVGILRGAISKESKSQLNRIEAAMAAYLRDAK